MLTLLNPRNPEVGAVTVEALADTGSVHMIIPEHVRIQLRLDEQDRKEVTLADGSKRLVPYVGPVQLSFGDRHSFAGAFALGDEVRVGTAAIQDLYLVLDTALETVTVHSDSPYLVRGARGCRT